MDDRSTGRAGVLGVLTATCLAVSGCSSHEDLLPDARCGHGVVANQQDAERIMELAPAGIERLRSEFDQDNFGGYQASCTVGDGSGRDGLALDFEASFLSNAAPPSKTSLHVLARPLPGQERLARVTSDVPGVGGVSGEGSAVLRAPCTLSESKTLPPDMREGAMMAYAWAPNASDADSREQRQNAADLALSFLRHAVQKCDDPPKLPESVHIKE